MSLFLPEEQNQNPSSTTSLARGASPTAETTPQDIALMQRVLSAAARNVNLIPSDFMAYVLDFIQTSRLSIPIGQVFGFAGYTVQASDFIPTIESTGSTSYTDLASVGPTLSGIADGQYLIIVTAIMAVVGTTGDGAFMSVSVNGSTPNDADAAQNKSLSEIGVAGWSLQTLNGFKNGSSNSIVAKYKVSTGTASTAKFSQRKMIALKYANL